eukprot:m.152877 g.152877  ORF g.152877 m.152877 type:complete len:187 (+) comp23426_c0_seq1:41-601(+)
MGCGRVVWGWLIAGCLLAVAPVGFSCVVQGTIMEIQNSSSGIWCASRGVLHQGDLTASCGDMYPSIDCIGLGLVSTSPPWYGASGISNININASNSTHVCFGVTCMTKQLCGTDCKKAASSIHKTVSASDYGSAGLAVVGTIVYFFGIALFGKCCTGKQAEDDESDPDSDVDVYEDEDDDEKLLLD